MVEQLTFGEGFHFAFGMMTGLMAAVGLFFIGAILVQLAVNLIGRYRQAGRKGYGFELRGWPRVAKAWELFTEYDLWK